MVFAYIYLAVLMACGLAGTAILGGLGGFGIGIAMFFYASPAFFMGVICWMMSHDPKEYRLCQYA